MTLGNKIRNQLNNPAYFVVVNQIRAEISISDKVYRNDLRELRNTVYDQTWRTVYNKVYDHTLFGKRYLTK